MRPLPFPEPDRLVRVCEALDEQDTRADTLDLSEITLRQSREQGGEIFSGLAAAAETSVTLGNTTGEAPHYLSAARVTADFFAVSGLAPAMGRNFAPEEDSPNVSGVVLLSRDLWQRRSGGRPDVLGKSILLDGHRAGSSGSCRPDSGILTAPTSGFPWRRASTVADSLPLPLRRGAPAAGGDRRRCGRRDAPAVRQHQRRGARPDERQARVPVRCGTASSPTFGPSFSPSTARPCAPCCSRRPTSPVSCWPAPSSAKPRPRFAPRSAPRRGSW